MGGDTPNEDEYSAALERLLEGCPAYTCCSSQIGGTASYGEGPYVLSLKRGDSGGGSQYDWGGGKTGEQCVPVCSSGK